MFRKLLTIILLVLLTLGISAKSSATWQGMAWNVVKEFAKDTAIDVVQSFFRNDVKPEEVAALKGKIFNLERQLYSVKEGGYNPPDFDSVEQTVLRLTKIVNAMESRFSSLEDRVTILEKRVIALEQDIPFVRQTIAAWKGNSELNTKRIERQEERYFIILGSYPKSQYFDASKRLDYLKSFGYVDLFVGDTNNYPNLTNELYIVAIGPLSKHYALELKERLSSVVPDAYVKSGW